ncbi:MAG: hypothetical protein IAF02_04265, partial [Anaerolineae bacterium]|nr:hypothetical protein [Anaerolineae bacterium]
EQAWLWLSGALTADEDKRVCLENVLALNPENQAAKRGLAKLNKQMPDPTPAQYLVKNPAFAQNSSYNDIWEQDAELCAFCAQELTGDEQKCPRCSQVLVTKTYRYAQPSTNLHILWIMLLAIGQLYLLQAIYDIMVTRNILLTILPIFMMIVFFSLTAGVYFRQYWAYISTIILLITILVANIVGMFMPAELSQVAMVHISPILDNVVNPAINFTGTALRGFQLIAIVIALIVAVFKAAPDFEREETRHHAKLEKGLQSSGSYHGAAQRAAKKGEWATAVLNWQRAAAAAPTNRQYQRQLGIAYARLGFYQRSADVLQSALSITPDPVQQAQLNRLLTTVQKHINTQT